MVFLNNQLTDFSFVSRQNNGGLIANSVEANKKPRSSMAPTLIFKNNDLVGIIGSPGSSRIICYVAKTIFYLVNFDLDVKVIDLPHLCSRGSNSEIEKGERGNEITKQLKLLNHDITRNKMTSGLNIIWKKKIFWIGASDYRREGVAVWILITQRSEFEIFLKLIISILIVFALKIIFPGILKGVKVMVIMLLIAIVFNIVLGNNIL